METEDIRFKCDGCGTKYKTNPRRGGKLVECKNCGSTIFIPASSTSPNSKTS